MPAGTIREAMFTAFFGAIALELTDALHLRPPGGVGILLLYEFTFVLKESRNGNQPLFRLSMKNCRTRSSVIWRSISTPII
jgi:hypothetical protein